MGAPVPRTAAMGGKQTVVVLQLKAHGKGQLQKTAGIGLGLHLVVQPGQKGLELQPEMAWTPVRLYRKQTERLGARAMSTEAKNYKLQIKWAK